MCSCTITRAVEHNVIDRLWIRTTFTREGNSALCVEALGVFAGEGVPSEEAKVSSASHVSFLSGLALAITLRP